MSARLPAPAQPPGVFPLRVPLRTRWSDEDNHGVLNNAVYLTLFEEARLASLRDAMDGARFPFVLAQANVAFRRPGRGGAEVAVEVATLRIGERSFTQAYRVLGPDGEVWCEAEAVLVAVDADGAACPLPARLRAALAASASDAAAPTLTPDGGSAG
jgi:acyl-CoA thioesterase FadM